MKERRHKVHYVENRRHDIGLCGLGGEVTYVVNNTTCRICMFKYLAGQAPWAQGFLDELRGRVGRTQPPPVIVPARTPEPMDGKVEGTGDSQGCPLSYEGIAQETIREAFTVQPAWGRPVQPIMDDGGAATDAVGVQPRQITQGAGNAGQVSYEPSRYNKTD